MSPTTQSGVVATGTAADDDADDYMSMTFAPDQNLSAETSLQRTQRLRRESRARGHTKSRAELALEAAQTRDRALATSLLDGPGARHSKGLAIMARMGFAPGTGLGLGRETSSESGGGGGGKGDASSRPRTEPIPLSLRDGRGGIGLDAERKRRFREAAGVDDGRDHDEHGGGEEEQSKKTARLDPDAYRERVGREREDARLERRLLAAQRLAERLDDEHTASASEGEETSAERGSSATSQRGSRTEKAAAPTEPVSSRPLRSLPVLYRGLVRHREEKERDRRMRHDLEQSLSRLPTYQDDDDDDDDPGHRMALGERGGEGGGDGPVYVTADDLDEDDAELDEFNALDVRERLRRVLSHLRERHRYCFWCKMTYSDAEMEGCPGLTEEEHD